MEVRRPQVLEAGLFLLVVALPLAFFPLSESPFVDVKLFVLAIATSLVWLSGLVADRRLVPPALVVGAVLGLAWLFGVDRAESLVGSIRPTGIAMLACALSLVVVAPSIPDELLERARRWLVWSALFAAALAVVNDVSPELLDALAEGQSFVGSTFGNPVLLAGFLAAAIPAALGDSGGRPWRTISVFAILGLGFAVVGERSAYVLPPVAFVASWWLVRPGRRMLVAGAGAIVVAAAVWTAIPVATAEGTETPGHVAAQFGTLTAERQRFAVWGANARAVAERPVLGWGPANGWSAYVSSGTEGQIETAGRFWGDAHNLVIEIGVISGVLGLAAFGWLFVRLAPGVARPDPGRGWAAAAAATVVVYSLYEPLDVTLTPLMLVLAAAARRGASATAPSERRWSTAATSAVAAVLAGVALVAAVGLVSSALEEWGRTHAGSRWAIERAVAIAPWRLTAAEGLAVDLALDGRAGDEAAAAEARDVVGRLAEAHPQNPGVRLLAADVELLLRNFPATQAWIREHLEVFPNDDVRVPEEEPGFALPG